MCTYLHVSLYVCGSQNNLWVLVIFFHHVGSRNWNQVIRLGVKYLYPLSDLLRPTSKSKSKSKSKSVVDCKDAVMVQIHCQQDSESPGKQKCFYKDLTRKEDSPDCGWHRSVELRCWAKLKGKANWVLAFISISWQWMKYNQPPHAPAIPFPPWCTKLSN